MDRLSKTEWLEHGLETLKVAGFTALKADQLAKSLGVSRGSFYWHFKNLADFHTHLLRYWQSQQVENTISALETAHLPAIARLEALFTMAISTERSLECAIRVWATQNPAVQQALVNIDMQSMNYIAQLLIELGLEQTVAVRRAKVLYLSYIGNVIAGRMLAPQDSAQLITELMQLAQASASA